MGSNIRKPLYDSTFDFPALRLGYEIFAQQFIQKILAQIEFVPYDCFLLHIAPQLYFEFNPTLIFSARSTSSIVKSLSLPT